MELHSPMEESRRLSPPRQVAGPAGSSFEDVTTPVPPSTGPEAMPAAAATRASPSTSSSAERATHQPLPDPATTAMAVASTQLRTALNRQRLASEKLRAADPAGLHTLSEANKISDHMAVVAGALCLLLGCAPTWTNAQALLAEPDFMDRAAGVSDERVEARSLRKVTQLVKTKRLKDFVQHAASEPKSLSPVEEAERLLAAWVISVADAGTARKAVRKTSKRQLRDAAAAATTTAGAGAGHAGAIPAADGPTRKRLARRSSSLRRLRRAGAPALMEPVQERPSREERGSASHRTPRPAPEDAERGQGGGMGSASERESVGSARSASAKRIQREGRAAASAAAASGGDVHSEAALPGAGAKPGPAADSAGAESPARAVSRDAAGAYPAPKPVDPNAAIEALENGLFVSWFNPSSGWFSKKQEDREVWLHRSPAADAIAWAPVGSKREEPKTKLLLRDIKRVGFGLLTPTLEKNGDRSQPELHVVVQAGPSQQLEVLMRNVSERDIMLAAVGHLIASRR